MGDKALKAQIAKLKREKAAAKKIILRKKKEAFAAKKQKQKMMMMAREKKMKTAMLKKELSQLKNPRSSAFRKNIKRAARLGGKAVTLIRQDISERKARIQFKKVKGGFLIFLGGKLFENVKSEKELLLKVNKLRKLQGRPQLKRIR